MVDLKWQQPSTSTNPNRKRTNMTAKLLSRRVLSLAVTAMILGGGLVVAKTHLIGVALAQCAG
jgi:hypothetical protein